MTIEECKQIAEAELERLRSASEQAFGRSFKPCKLGFALYGRTAGRAFLKEWRIELNAILFRENQSEFINTIGHEWAHLVAYAVFQDCGHGADFYWTCGRLNIATRRCHSYSTQNVGKAQLTKIKLQEYL